MPETLKHLGKQGDRIQSKHLSEKRSKLTIFKNKKVGPCINVY